MGQKGLSTILCNGSSCQCWGRMEPAEGQKILSVTWSVPGCWETKCHKEVLPPPLISDSKQKKGWRPGPELSQSESTESCLSTALTERLHGVAVRVAKSRPLHQCDISKVKVGCEVSAGIKLPLSQAVSHTDCIHKENSLFLLVPPFI